MAKFTAANMENYISQLRIYSDNIQPVLNKAVYNGASEIANAVTAEIRALPEVPENHHGTEDKQETGITKAQKQGLLDGFGISHLQIEENDMRFVKIGFVGYNKTATKKYPKGQPNAMIARSLISGTSFRAKNDFMARALKKTKAAAQEKIEETFQNELEKLQK